MKWYKNNPVGRLINKTRSRAKKMGLPFGLVSEDIAFPENCPICGVRLRSGNRETLPSLDRIVPGLGYIAENVVVICGGCNRKKDNMSPEEMYAIADYVYRLRKVRGLC